MSIFNINHTMGLLIRIVFLSLLLLNWIDAFDKTCYRKAGMYNIYYDYGTDNREILVYDFDKEVQIEVLLLEQQINWQRLKSNMSSTFLKMCHSANRTYDYNIVINETIHVYINNNNTCNISMYNLTYRGNSINVSVCNFTVGFTLGNCRQHIDRSTFVPTNESMFSLIVSSSPISTTRPFVPRDSYSNCTLTALSFIKHDGQDDYEHISLQNQDEDITRQNSSYSVVTVVEGDNSTDCELNRTTMNCFRIMYPPNADYDNSSSNSTSTSSGYNLTIVSSTRVEHKCLESSMVTILDVVGVLKEYNDTLKKLGLETTKDTAKYFDCRILDSSTCNTDIFLPIARKTTMSRTSGNHPHRSRNVRSVGTDDDFCHHKSFGLIEGVECEDRSFYTPITDSFHNRYKRSPGKRPLPPTPKTNSDGGNGNVVLLSSQELGARPKIHRTTQDLQMGSFGRDGDVVGEETVYASVKRDISAGIRSLTRTINPVLTDASSLEEFTLLKKPLPKVTSSVVGNTFTLKESSIRSTAELSRQISRGSHKSVSFGDEESNLIIRPRTSSKGLLKKVNTDSTISLQKSLQVDMTKLSNNKVDYIESKPSVVDHSSTISYRHNKLAGSYSSGSEASVNSVRDSSSFKSKQSSSSRRSLLSSICSRGKSTLCGISETSSISNMYKIGTLRRMSEPVSNNMYREEYPYNNHRPMSAPPRVREPRLRSRSGTYMSIGTYGRLYEDDRSEHIYNNIDREDQLIRLAESNDRVSTVINTVALSSHITASNNMLMTSINTAKTVGHTQFISNIISSVLNTIGGSLSITGSGSPKVAAAGILLQGLGGLVNLGTAIHQLIVGQEPPKDPVLEKFSSYAKHMEKSSAGSRVCMMPDSQITVTLAYRHKSMNSHMENENAIFTDNIPSIVYYMRNSQIVYSATVTLICPIGTLRLFEANINSYASLMRIDDDGSKHYSIHGIFELLSVHPNVTFTCGNEPGVIFMPFEQKLEDMQLLRIYTSDEPKEARSMPSNVCDLYPIKKFYLLAGNCPFDMSQTAITYVTCSTLLKMATYQPDKNRWILLNPFSKIGSDEYIQLFYFSKYDFNDVVIRPNDMTSPENVCGQPLSDICYWNQPMALEDVTVCTSRIRKLYLELSLMEYNGFNSFVMTCPYGSSPFYIGSSKIIVIPLNTQRTSVRYTTDKKQSILVSCVHNSNPSLKSDMIHVTFTEKSRLPADFANYDSYDSKDLLFSCLSDLMPFRSRTCKHYKVNKDCRNDYYIKDRQEPEYYLSEITLKGVRLDNYYTGKLTYKITAALSKYFSSPVSFELDVGEMDKSYKIRDDFWKYSKNGKRTYSSIQVTLFACSKIAGRYNLGNRLQNFLYNGINKKGWTSTNITFESKIRNDDKSLYDDIMENCTVNLNFDDKVLRVYCPGFSIKRSYFENTNYNGICVAVATSRDHCALTEDNNIWNSHKIGYSDEESETTYPSCNKHIPKWGYYEENFCYYKLTDASMAAPDYDPCSSSMIIGFSPVYVETKMISPPYIKEFDYEPNINEYGNKNLVSKLNKLYLKYEELINHYNNPLIPLANEFGKYMTNEGRDIFRLNANAEDIQSAYEQNKLKAEKVQQEIDETLQDIFVHSMNYKEVNSLIRYAVPLRCCVLNGENVYKYFPLESYICGNYSDYVFDFDNSSYVYINNSFIEESVYKEMKVPLITCFNITLIPVSTDKQIEEYETAVVVRAMEDSINELFEEYNTNITAIMNKFIQSLPEEESHTYVTVTVIMGIATSFFVILLTGLIMQNKIFKRKYKIFNNSIETLDPECISLKQKP